jgi:hypothetical protein
MEKEMKIPHFESSDDSLLLNQVQYDKLKKISDRKKLDTVSIINQWITKHIEQESIQPVL